MADQESLRRLTEDDYEPRSSLYLREGYKDDNFELTNVMVGETRAIGSVKVNNFFPPMDGEFHLSASMAVIWMSQLATIFSFYDNGLLRKDREIYLRDLSMKCRKRIVELNEIFMEIEITSKSVRKNTIHYRENVDIDVGSIIGKASWFMPDKPFQNMADQGLLGTPGDSQTIADVVPE